MQPFDTHGFDTHGFDTHGFDTRGGPGGVSHPSQAFARYRPARVVWGEFVVWWKQRYPGRGLPRTAHIVTLTGLSRRFVMQQRQKEQS